MVLARRLTVAMAIAAVAVGGLTACKSSGSSGGGTKTAAASAPLKFLVDTTLTGGPATGGAAFPGGVYGAKAAAAALNKKGGINGHKVEIIGCDNKADPNGGPACARTAASQGALAVVGSFDIVGAPKVLPILQKEGIPYIGGLPGSPQELSSPISFQFDGGVNLGGFGTIAQMKSQGCKSAADFSPGGPAAALDPLLIKQYKKADIKFTRIVATSGTADMTPFISQALAVHPDCVVAEGPAPDTAKIVAGLRKVGAKVKIFTSIGSLIPQLLKALGSLTEGVYADNSTDLASSSDPLVTQFRNDMTASMGGQAAANLNEFAQDGWSSVMVVDQALKGVSNISSTSLMAAMNKLSDATPGNVHDPVDFTKTFSSKLYPRLFNPYVKYFVIKNGQYTELDNQWHDVSQYIP